MIHVYNFKKRFEAPIVAGTKRQTIRAHRKDGRVPYPGDRLHGYVDLRSRRARKIVEATVTWVRNIAVDWPSGMIFLDGQQISSPILMSKFARADGFADVAEMELFFRAQYGASFDGLVIQWGAP